MQEPRASMLSPALALCCCLAALPLIGCTAGVGAGAPPLVYAPPGTGAPPQAYVPPAVGAAWAPYRGGERVYAGGSGGPAAILVVLPGPGDLLTSDPRLWAAQGFDVVMPPPDVYRLAADPEIAVERMIASAREMAGAPIWLVGPSPAIDAAMTQAPMAGPGQISGVVVTSLASNAGTCSERMVYADTGTGAPPKVTVTKSGNACPPGPSFGPGNNSATVPAAPAVRPHAPRLIEASAAGRGSPSSRRNLVRHVAELIKAAPAS